MNGVPAIDWRPMSEAREVRHGRHVLLKLETKVKSPPKTAFGGAVVGYWLREGRQWLLAEPDDFDDSSCWGLIDDDFSAWGYLPAHDLTPFIDVGDPTPSTVAP